MRKKCVTILAFGLLTAIAINCNSKKVDNIKEFFERVESETDKDTLVIFQASQIDSAGKCFDLINHTFESEYYKLDRNSIILKNIDTVEVVSDSMKILVLEIQFHYYMNGEVADLFDIRYEIRKMHEYKEKIASADNSSTNPK